MQNPGILTTEMVSGPGTSCLVRDQFVTPPSNCHEPERLHRLIRHLPWPTIPAMPARSENLPVLELRLTDVLLDFERLDEAWPKGRGAVERARTGRQREDALSEIVTLHQRIVAGRAETLADAAAQLRRLAVMADERPTAHALLAPPSARQLVASVLVVVEREADGAGIGEAAAQGHGQPRSTRPAP